MTAKELSFSPCIIYCHGNAGNKVDIIEIFDFLLWDFNICSFDFSGAGQSEGDYVTLGYNEQNDVKSVVEFLRRELNIQKIILYGRSMGAVAALRYAEQDPNLKVIILDSPFSSFFKLSDEILSNKFFIPSVLSKILLNIAKEKILEKIENFDISEFKPYLNARNVQVPTIIIHGLQDSLVGIDHSRTIMNNLHKNTYKKMLEVDGEHNDCRSAQDTELIRDFIMQFAYDGMVLKEHKRRLMLKNIHLNYTNKYGININSVISNFRNNIKENLKNEKIRKMNNLNVHSQIKVLKSKGICYISNSKNLKENMSNSFLFGDYKDEIQLKSKSQDKKEEDIIKSQLNKNDNMNKEIKIRYHSVLNNKIKKRKKYFIDKKDFTIGNNNEVNINKESDLNIILPLKLNFDDAKNEKEKEAEEKQKIKNIFFIQSNNIILTSDEPKKKNLDLSTKYSNAPLNDSQMQIDLLVSPHKSSESSLSSRRIRSERLNHLGEIFGCEVRIKSDQISFIDVHKQSMKRSSFIQPDSSINVDTTTLQNETLESNK